MASNQDPRPLSNMSLPIITRITPTATRRIIIGINHIGNLQMNYKRYEKKCQELSSPLYENGPGYKWDRPL